MPRLENSSLNFDLDENGRARLSDDMLAAIHEIPDFASAAGLNGVQCERTVNYNECTNSQECSGSDNTNCTNQGDCYPSMNNGCSNSANCPGTTTQPGPGGF